MTAPKAPTQQYPPDNPTDSRPGTWSRLELMQMNARFAIAMARALGEKIGRESEPPRREFGRSASQEPSGLSSGGPTSLKDQALTRPCFVRGLDRSQLRGNC